jgi:hypothetical protein
MYQKRHKGIPFPPVTPTPTSVYRDAFRRFPFWYRWYIRVRTVFSSQTIESTTKNHHLHQLRRRIAITAKTVVDPNVPALIGGFHSAIREIQGSAPRDRTFPRRGNWDGAGFFSSPRSCRTQPPPPRQDPRGDAPHRVGAGGSPAHPRTRSIGYATKDRENPRGEPKANRDNSRGRFEDRSGVSTFSVASILTRFCRSKAREDRRHRSASSKVHL